MKFLVLLMTCFFFLDTEASSCIFGQRNKVVIERALASQFNVSSLKANEIVEEASFFNIDLSSLFSSPSSRKNLSYKVNLVLNSGQPSENNLSNCSISFLTLGHQKTRVQTICNGYVRRSEVSGSLSCRQRGTRGAAIRGGSRRAKARNGGRPARKEVPLLETNDR